MMNKVDRLEKEKQQLIKTLNKYENRIGVLIRLLDSQASLLNWFASQITLEDTVDSETTENTTSEEQA